MANTYVPIFAVGKYDSIAPALVSGKLTYPAYVLCNGENENFFVFVDKDLNIQKIKGYNQDSIIYVDALPETDIRTDAFYICDGMGYLYMDEKWTPIFSDNDSGGSNIKSYNELEDVPIENKYGTTSDLIILSDLDGGYYSVTGNYQIYDDGTVYITSRHILFFVDSDYEYKYITKFETGSIVLYKVDLESNELVDETTFTTAQWVEEQGYLKDEDITSISDEEIAGLFDK